MPRRDHDEIDPALSEALRRTYVRPVDDEVAAQHVTQIAAAARAGGTPARPAPAARASRRAWRPVLAAVAALLLLPVALATAGVDLPGPVDAPYHQVGIKLPHQSDDASTDGTAPARRATPATPASPAARPATPPRRTAGRNAGKQRRASRAEQRRHRTHAPKRRGRSGDTPSSNNATAPPRGNGRRTAPRQLRKGAIKRAAKSPTR